MIAIVKPQSIKGHIMAPAGKSSMQRACAAALVRKGITIIHNPGHSNDDNAAIGVITALGAKPELQPDGTLKITSNGVQPVNDAVNCGESGLGIRMFTPIISLSERTITINGEGSLVTRPMDFFDAILPQLSVGIQSNNGKLPLVIKGPMKPASITVDGSLSSQFLTGLLMSYAAAGASDVELTVTDLKSKPYIDLTLKVMLDFGWKVENRNYESFYFPPNPAAPKNGTLEYTVEGDWSGAAFLLVAGAIAGDITVKGLDVFSTQADRAVLQALMSSGAKISVQTDKIEIGPAPLKAFHFNATECPDLFPPLVALAAYCDGKSVIEGAQRLTHKESNRAITLQEEFGKLGVQIDLQDDLMIIHGGKGLNGATTYSHHDHRIAMACAVAALKASGEVTIESADAINKSYPDFYQHLQQLGGSVSLK
ncbi:3-phosphoshikimate 1-carboxyvinyltransferase [Pseudoflavitalea sp. G-6-1-2]|uniref:3-phosphoshikimate 1-carboxyvinyltransferase n=1 Tax=Pseudoflavitalea sp. G-6-1-2 TaxID=2728841 RepID=UPI00146B718A|nr:3-phosphoshikimate 1-carboxyvinyltransferase [Pseudoflavitalea sp. G-6-1-2]NML23236.1 3-phosphoshikimate 1-carboxyvinyltransferase [Pseudoflavitalea sp. G-6-1-2]